MGAVEMRPECGLVVGFRREADVAGLAGQRHELALGLDQAGDAEPRAGAEDRPRPGVGRQVGPDLAHPGGLDRRQRQGLRLEVVEQQAVVRPSCAAMAGRR